ncbi:ABC transporter family protein [[Clostridium] sordellii ATCC 9714]|nr:ABC transporter family protein [[Clostridium] sordellii ATCC 9714] [Paeniclostridium sordellii ATCC 9714]
MKINIGYGGLKMKKSIRVNNIKKIYGKGENAVKAIDGITLEIESGKFTAIVGESGSGKSTLLHCMAGLDKPTEGNVYLENQDIYKLNDDKLSKIRVEEFGFVFQSFNLIPVVNVYENIVLPVSIDHNKIDKNYIDDIIKKLGLENQIKNSQMNYLEGNNKGLQ